MRGKISNHEFKAQPQNWGVGSMNTVNTLLTGVWLEFFLCIHGSLFTTRSNPLSCAVNPQCHQSGTKTKISFNIWQLLMIMQSKAWLFWIVVNQEEPYLWKCLEKPEWGLRNQRAQEIAHLTCTWLTWAWTLASHKFPKHCQGMILNKEPWVTPENRQIWPPKSTKQRETWAPRLIWLCLL